jgi:hypothetical protein
MISLLCPNGAIGLQPRVAASATLGQEAICPQPQRGCVCFVHFSLKNYATALRLKILFVPVPRVAETATLG